VDIVAAAAAAEAAEVAVAAAEEGRMLPIRYPAE
jgi:hypothetical protein